MIPDGSNLTMHLNWTDAVGQDEVEASFEAVLLTFFVIAAFVLICTVCIVVYHRIGELLAVRDAYHVEINGRDLVVSFNGDEVTMA